MVFAEESAKEAAKGAKDKEDPKEKDGTTEGDANKMTTVKPHVGSAEGSVPFPPTEAAAATTDQPGPFPPFLQHFSTSCCI